MIGLDESSSFSIAESNPAELSVIVAIGIGLFIMGIVMSAAIQFHDETKDLLIDPSED